MKEENPGDSQQKYDVMKIEPGTLPKKEPQVLTKEQKIAFDNALDRIAKWKISEYKRWWVIVIGLYIATAGCVGVGVQYPEPLIIFSGYATAALLKDAAKIGELIRERAGIESRREKSSEANSEMDEIFNTILCQIVLVNNKFDK